MRQFKPGDVVICNKAIENRPRMVVSDIVSALNIDKIVAGKKPDVFKQKSDNNNPGITGIRVFWFSSTGMYCTAVFNFKDLEYAKPNKSLNK